MGERIRISNGEVWLDEDTGIVRIDLDAGGTVGLSEAKEQMEAMAKLSNGKRLPLLVYSRVQSNTQEAREYFANEGRAVYRAVALLGMTATGAAVGKIWVAAFDHPDAPSRVYFDEQAAIEWLKTFVEK